MKLECSGNRTASFASDIDIGIEIDIDILRQSISELLETTTSCGHTVECSKSPTNLKPENYIVNLGPNCANSV
jgi:hypothetical protein